MRPILSGALFFVVALSGLVEVTPLHADQLPLARVLIVADSLRLHEHHSWRRLLHFESGEQTSSVLTDSFFLADEGRSNPRAELAATLSAYFQTDVNGDAHPRCRFPARYYWLSHQLELPGYEPAQHCPKLQAWGLFEQVQSVSLLMVSGYLGNPASTFGHSLLKFNTDNSRDAPSLFEPTVNYGANVPQQVNPLLYILRGVTGGYEGGFSDNYFYTQDLIYSRREFRDMWEYRLALTDYQRILLGLHVWEMLGKKYQYFFFDRNCGFRLAELFDLVIEEELLGGAGWWYAPVDLFHQIDSINENRIRAGKPGIIASVAFVPSARRKLFYELSGLHHSEIRVLNQMVEEEYAFIDRQLEGLATDRQIAMLNAMLAIQNYQDMAIGPHLSSARQVRRHRLLMARLQRPAQQAVQIPVPFMSSPTEGFPPMKIGLGLGGKPGQDVFALINWSPYSHESVGYNILEGGELVVADVEFGVGDGSTPVFLSRFDIIRLLNLHALPIPITEERNLSWQLRLGIERKGVHGGAYNGIAGFGAGRAWRIGRRLTGLALANLEIHTRVTHTRIRPQLQVLYRGNKISAAVGLDAINEGYTGNFRMRGRGQALYRLGRNHSIAAEYRPSSNTATITLNSYF